MADGLEMEEVPCNLCGNAEAVEVYNRPITAESLSADCAATTDEFKDYGRIVRCSGCGLVYTNPRPTREELLKGYGACVDDTYVQESSSRSINGHLSLSVIKRFVRSGKLLEIGGSTGYFLNAARTDFDVMGLEPSQWACSIAKERFRLDMTCGSVETANFPKNSFDVIALIDVIEHLCDPRATIERAVGWLKPGGILYLVTPDIGSLSAKVLRGSWWGLRPAHIYYYDRSTMKRLLDECGLDIVLTKSFGRIFSLDYWATRMRNYPALIYRGLRGAIGALSMEHKLVYIDTRDSMEICARKR